MPTPTTILGYYRRDRADAETGGQRDAVWRTYALALIETDTERKCGAIPFRRAFSDADLPIRNPAHWSRIPYHDLKDLWRALEQARHNPSAPDD